MASNALPAALYEGLLGKLVTVLELTQKPEGTVTPQAKQALLHAVCNGALSDDNMVLTGCSDERL